MRTGKYTSTRARVYEKGIRMQIFLQEFLDFSRVRGIFSHQNTLPKVDRVFFRYMLHNAVEASHILKILDILKKRPIPFLMHMYISSLISHSVRQYYCAFFTVKKACFDIKVTFEGIYTPTKSGEESQCCRHSPF